MDRLFSKYADPFSFIDGMISCGRFEEFVLEFLKADDEERVWQFYLHKIFDKSFTEFKNSLEQKIETHENLETTIQNSFDILNSFKP